MSERQVLEALETLRPRLDAQAVLTGDAVAARGGGWFRVRTEATAVLRPRDVRDVAAILAHCHAVRQPVVVHGGLTGAVDATASSRDELILAIERMNGIEDLDPAGRTMTVQAGVPLQMVQEAALGAGLIYPVDLGARGSCQIGGNIATNAGGNRVIRYGMTRENVLGVEAVLADGSVVSSLNRMVKNNAGYDLKQLFVGSEGTLGVVTRAVLRLCEAPRSQNAALVALSGFDQVVGLLKHMSQALGGTLSAFEVMWPEFYQAVTTPPAAGRPPLPPGQAFYVLIDALGADQGADSARFEQALQQAFQAGLVADAAFAQSERERAQLWALRDDVEQVNRHGRPFIFDVSLPLRDMADYVAGVRRALAGHWADHHCYVFGHVGDGNLHFAISVGTSDPAARRLVEEAVYRPLTALHGSVSAEHGIGREKRAYLPWCRSEAEIALMRRLKQFLDPHGILNPGRVFDG